MKKALTYFKENRKEAIIITFGLFLRFLIMPITIHHDLLSSVWRANSLIYDHVFRISSFSEVLMAGYLWLIKPITGNLPVALLQVAQDYRSVGPNLEVYSEFLAHNQLFLYLFSFKIIFLLADLVLLWFLCKSKIKNNWVLLFWAINPFVIYSVYAWGRFGIFAILFAFLSLLFLQREKVILSILMLSLAIIFRPTFIIYLLPILIYASKSKTQLLSFGVLSLAPYYLVSLVMGLFRVSSPSSISNFIEFPLYGNIGTGFTAINLMIVALALVVFYMLKERMKKNGLSFEQFIFFTALFVFAFFAFSFFNPQYLAWITPIAFYVVYLKKETFWGFLVLFIAFFLLADFYFGCYASICLFGEPTLTTFAQTFFSIKSQFLEKITDGKMISVFHTGLVLAFSYIGYSLWERIYVKKG